MVCVDLLFVVFGYFGVDFIVIGCYVFVCLAVVFFAGVESGVFGLILYGG